MNDNKLTSCSLCPRNCHADRDAGEKGICGCNSRIFVARAALHMWEEPCISGEQGSGTVFFSGCPLKCVFCQNGRISDCTVGKEISIDRLTQIFLELQEKGANNINLVTPTHYVLQIISALEAAKKRGLRLPVVYNTGGYENVDTLKLLDGMVDIYLPDMKYMDCSLALKYSRAEDYPEKVKAALNEMYRQVGNPVFNANTGLMRRGMVVRHLVLPGNIHDSKNVIKYLYDIFGDNVYMSIMSQYTPMKEFLPGGSLADKFPELGRKLSKKEYDEVVDYAIELGIENAFIQEGDPADESFIPDFNYEGV